MRHGNTFRFVCLATLLLLLPAAPAGAQRPTLDIPRVDAPPDFRAIVEEGARPPGVEVTGFRQREPGDGTPVSQPTSVYLSYDDTHIYAVFLCRDEPGRVRANLSRRENIMSDDVVGVMVDTYHDGRRSYMFLANPLGIQMDGVTAEGQDDDYTFDALWRSEGRVTPDGYAVLFEIPFRSLRFSNAPDQTWGVALARIIPRSNETSFWPYITRRISSVGQQMATLEGLRGISPGRNLQAIPYASFSSARFLDDENGDRGSDTTGRVGVDAKAVIKDAFTLDLTANPDFSQIESDEPQVTVNQRFEVFFPEKRPFFIENAAYFETPEPLFFSRRLADPKLGVRLTGKSHGWAFGGLFANDKQPGQVVADTDPRYDKFATAGVLRVQREFARQSYLGGIFLDREIGPAGNRVFGADGRWRFDDNWSVVGQVVGSDTTDVEGVGRTGSLATFTLQREGRNFDYSSSYVQRSPGFRSELGFIQRVDMREMEHGASYAWFPDGGAVLRVGPDLEVGALWDYGGVLQDWTVEPGFEIELPGQTEIDWRHWQQSERFEGREFRQHSTRVGFQSEWLSWLAVEADYQWGTGINYYPPDGIAPFLANVTEAEAGLTIRPSAQLRLDETYIFSRLTTPEDVVLPPGTGGGDIFNNHIVRSRVSYQFTREFSARAILDYEAVLPNRDLVSLEREKRFAADILFTYLINPWTAVYVGYTDAYENWRFSSPADRPPERDGAPTTSVGRQVFAKISYLFRY